MTPSPRVSTTPVPSWPMARPVGGSGTLTWSPRQTCRSEPQMPAWVMRSSTAPGAGSGTSYSCISKGLPYSTQAMTRPFIAHLLTVGFRWNAMYHKAGGFDTGESVVGARRDCTLLKCAHSCEVLDRIVSGCCGTQGTHLRLTASIFRPFRGWKIFTLRSFPVFSGHCLNCDSCD